MPEAPEAWGTMPIDDLMALVESTTTLLGSAFQELAADEGAYQRRFWDHWQKLPEEMSVAAANRDCERVCKELDEQRILGRALVETLRVKRDSLVSILQARTK